jgi:hypothetical protein
MYIPKYVDGKNWVARIQHTYTEASCLSVPVLLEPYISCLSRVGRLCTLRKT